LKLCHGTLADFGTWCSSCSMINNFVTKAVLIERAVDICISWSRRLHNTWIVGSQIWKSRGGGVPQCLIAGDATVSLHFMWPTILSFYLVLQVRLLCVLLIYSLF